MSNHASDLFVSACPMPFVPNQGDGVFRLGAGSDTAVLVGLDGLGGVWTPVVADVFEPDRCYVGTREAGVWLSEDGGSTWNESNTGLTFKEVWSLRQHPRTGQLFVGVGPAAVFTSSDRGGSWHIARQLMTLPDRPSWEFPGPPYYAHVKDIALHPNDAGLVFGAIEEGGVVRSRDGGRIWENLHNGVEFDCHAVELIPDDPKFVLVTSGTGIYRSEDGGDSFVASMDGLDRRYVTARAVTPTSPHVMFAGAAQTAPPGWRRPEGAGASLFRSVDLGAHWERLRLGDQDRLRAWIGAIAIDPRDDRSVYVGTGDGSIWHSVDGGDHFAKAATGPSAVSGISCASES